MATESVITMAAMGNKIDLGMLWDAHNYCSLSGLSLWDSTDMKEHQSVYRDVHTNLDIQV